MLTERQDAAVIGGGIAGLVTANRLAQLGIDVVVLEQGREEHYLCNTRYTGGTFHLCLLNIMKDESTLKQAIIALTGGFVSETLAAALALDGRRAVRWLRDEGIRFMKASGADVHSWVLSPPSRNRPGLDWKGRAGDVLLRTLEANLIRRGSSVQRNTRALSLIIEGGVCKGVVAQQGEHDVRYLANAVVIADGGFQGNAALVKQYICAYPERLKQRGAGTGRGDGVEMAMAIGAKLVGMDGFFGHVMSRDAMTNDKLWPYPYGDSLATAGIVVGPTGERFADEGRGGVYLANAIAGLADPFSATIIFDHAIWEGPARHGFIPANPHLPAVGGTLIRADNLEGLARELHIPPSGLVDTVQAYNAAISSDKLKSLAPPRLTSRYSARPIATAPFYGIPACAGITNTMGGIAINEHSQALRKDDSAIPGLYVAGAATGGLEGGPELGYVGGLTICGVTGLRAAEHIARSRGVTSVQG